MAVHVDLLSWSSSSHTRRIDPQVTEIIPDDIITSWQVLDEFHYLLSVAILASSMIL